MANIYAASSRIMSSKLARRFRSNKTYTTNRAPPGPAANKAIRCRSISSITNKSRLGCFKSNPTKLTPKPLTYLLPRFGGPHLSTFIPSVVIVEITWYPGRPRYPLSYVVPVSLQQDELVKDIPPKLPGKQQWSEA